MKSREVIDRVFGPPKSKEQKSLEDFKKKQIPKPEKPKSMDNTIIAETKEGKEIEFNLEEIKTYWIEFYKQNNLTELAEDIENIEINLTDEQIEKLKEKSKQGFDRLILLPSIEIQKQNLNQIKDQTEKPIKGLKDKQQYLETPDDSGQKGIWLSDTVKPNFPDPAKGRAGNIQTNNRASNKPYLLFLKDNPQIDADTVNKKAETLRQEFKQKNENGLTIEEYLIFQRDYIQRHIKEDKPHPDDFGGPSKATCWLLDSELDKQSSEPGQVLHAYWTPDNRRVAVHSDLASSSDSNIGARSSAIFEIL